MRREVLRMERITQLENGGKVLNNLNLQVFEGEIFGLVCLNTIGRAQLIQLVSQNLPLHYGRVFFREKPVNSYRHSDFSQNQVAVIDKQSRLVEDLSVADNIFVLRRGFKKYIIQPAVLRSQLAQFTQELGIQIDADGLVAGLTMFEKCVVELLKAVITGTRLVVVHNLSNTVSAADLSRFQALLRHYAAKGTAFLYVCDHHEEAFSISDRVALMENGQVLRVMECGGFNEKLVWSYALDFGRLEPANPAHEGHTALAFRNVHAGSLQGLSFNVEAGECVVLLDVNNNTFGDIVGLLNNEQVPEGGEILLEGKPLAAGKKRGRPVAFIQEAPVQSMLYYEMDYLENLCFLVGEKTPGLWLRPALRRSIQREYRAIVGVDIYERDIRQLSPQALYSLVYYRVHLANPTVAVCTQPFFGADMYLRHHILQLIDALRKKGIAVLLLSVNISDSLVLADRLLLVEDGKLKAEYHSGEFSHFSRAQGYPTE